MIFENQQPPKARIEVQTPKVKPAEEENIHVILQAHVTKNLKLDSDVKVETPVKIEPQVDNVNVNVHKKPDVQKSKREADTGVKVQTPKALQDPDAFDVKVHHKDR